MTMMMMMMMMMTMMIMMMAHLYAGEDAALDEGVSELALGLEDLALQDLDGVELAGVLLLGEDDLAVLSPPDDAQPVELVLAHLRRRVAVPQRLRPPFQRLGALRAQQQRPVRRYHRKLASSLLEFEI